MSATSSQPLAKPLRFQLKNTVKSARDVAENLSAAYAFMSSYDYRSAVHAISQRIAVGDDSFVKVHFDIEHWKRTAVEQRLERDLEPIAARAKADRS